MHRMLLTYALVLSSAVVAQAMPALPDGRDVSLGDGVLSPNIHIYAAFGDTDGDPATLAAGGHDPTREDGTIQAIELGLSLRLNEHVEGFATYAFGYGLDEEWTDELEEAFLKLRDGTGALDLRGGRMLNRIGLRNAQHLHSWLSVDQTLVNGRFLGEDGLATDGADLTWIRRGRHVAALTVSFGEVVAHDHAHGHADEDEHAEEHAEEEGHSEEAEAILFNDTFASANLQVQWHRDDFNQFTYGASIAGGENGLGGDTVLGALFLNYTWRENGLAPGGRQVIWNTECFVRDFDVGDAHDAHHEEDHAHEEEHAEEDHADEDGEFDGDTEIGAYTEVVYDTGGLLDAGVRVGYVQGIAHVGLPERVRVSPRVTLYAGASRNARLRLQYNYDDLDNGGDAHSVWAQFGYDFGGAEVR